MTETDHRNSRTGTETSLSPPKQALLYIGLGLGIGAIANTGWQIIGKWICGSKQPLNKGEMVRSATTIGVISGLIGSLATNREHNGGNRLKSLNVEEAKCAVASVVTNSSAMDALISISNPISEDIGNIAEDAVHRSPAAQALLQHVNKLDHKERKSLRDYMQGLAESVAKLDAKESDNISWEESVKSNDCDTIALR